MRVERERLKAESYSITSGAIEQRYFTDIAHGGKLLQYALRDRQEETRKAWWCRNRIQRSPLWLIQT